MNKYRINNADYLMDCINLGTINFQLLTSKCNSNGEMNNLKIPKLGSFGRKENVLANHQKKTLAAAITRVSKSSNRIKIKIVLP